MPPRVHYVKSARKDNPVAKKGEPYYWWQSYCSPKQFSKTPPRPWSLVGVQLRHRDGSATKHLRIHFVGFRGASAPAGGVGDDFAHPTSLLKVL